MDFDENLYNQLKLDPLIHKKIVTGPENNKNQEQKLNITFINKITLDRKNGEVVENITNKNLFYYYVHRLVFYRH